MKMKFAYKIKIIISYISMQNSQKVKTLKWESQTSFISDFDTYQVLYTCDFDPY